MDPASDETSGGRSPASIEPSSTTTSEQSQFQMPHNSGSVQGTGPAPGSSVVGTGGSGSMQLQQSSSSVGGVSFTTAPTSPALTASIPHVTPSPIGRNLPQASSPLGGRATSLHPNDADIMRPRGAAEEAEVPRLYKQLHDLHIENEKLKKQNHRISVLLDAAVAKLESLGISLFPPFDVSEGIRRLMEQSDSKGNSWQRDRDRVGGGGGAHSHHHHGHEGGKRHGRANEDGPGGSNPSGGTGASTHSTRKFRYMAELKNSNSAIQCAKFSPSGGLIAAGNFEGQSKLWSLSDNQLLLDLPSHDYLVSDLAWTPSSQKIVTASYDGSCKYTVLEHSHRPLHTFEPNEAFILSCSTTPHESLYFCSDAHGNVHLVDVRVKTKASHSVGVAHWRNAEDAAVTSLCTDMNQKGYLRLVTGDVAGMLNIWDIRMLSPSTTSGGTGTSVATIGTSPQAPGVPSVATQRTPTRRNVDNFDGATASSSSGAPVPGSTNSSYSREVVASWPNETVGEASSISYVGLHPHPSDDSERLIVLSDDCMLRLYGRSYRRYEAGVGKGGPGGDRGNSESGGGNAGDAASDRRQKTGDEDGAASSVGLGASSASRSVKTFSLRAMVGGLTTRSHPIKASYRAGNTRTAPSALFDDDAPENALKAVADSDLIAVGGTDNHVTIYDVVNMEQSSNSGVGGGTKGTTGTSGTTTNFTLSQLQRLEGHKDVVYGAVFHPDDPLIASYSADTTIRLWVPPRK